MRHVNCFREGRKALSAWRWKSRGPQTRGPRYLTGAGGPEKPQTLRTGPLRLAVGFYFNLGTRAHGMTTVVFCFSMGTRARGTATMPWLPTSFPLSHRGEGALLWQSRGVGPPGTIVHHRQYESISEPPAMVTGRLFSRILKHRKSIIIR